jgi:hypothetical protein
MGLEQEALLFEIGHNVLMVVELQRLLRSFDSVLDLQAQQSQYKRSGLVPEPFFPSVSPSISLCSL